jgi:hypothetical protein
MQHRLASNLRASCPSLPSAGITGMNHHADEDCVPYIYSTVFLNLSRVGWDHKKRVA